MLQARENHCFKHIFEKQNSGARVMETGGRVNVGYNEK